MRVRIKPTYKKESEITIPASKSLSHRALICAALANGTSTITNLVENDDTIATIECLKLLGAKFTREEDKLIVEGINDFNNYQGEVIDCHESGSTLRFLIPIFANSGKECNFTGRGKLMERPQTVYEPLFESFYLEDKVLHVLGKLSSGNYQIAGNISSQFITGLLFVLPLLEGDSVIDIIPPFESASYVDLTMDVLEVAGIEIERNGLQIKIKGNQQYSPFEYCVTGDDSQAAFFAVESLVGNKTITVHGLAHDSHQGDHIIIDLVKQFGGKAIEIEDGYIFSSGQLQATNVDLGNCPDLGPALFALATQAEGTSTFTNVARLRIKESDRVAVMEQELRKLGCKISSDENNVYITGKTSIEGCNDLNGHNDHRVVMSLSALASCSKEPLIIDDAQAINKSYPDYFKDLKETGMEVHEMIDKSTKITIIGLGLLGGSYAEGFYKAGYQVTGIDINSETITYAKEAKWIVDGGSDAALVQDSDIIISALYPTAFINWVKENQHYFKSGALLTDVTGIKAAVIKEVNSFLRSDVEYIACHPMAGREYKGIAYADSNEFLRANYIIVPTEKNSQRAIDIAYDIANILKFKNISILSPDEHDKIIGFVSQLCHVIAVSIMNISDNPKLVDYTGDSFRDLTRIANINEDLWPELFIYNKENLIDEVDTLIAEMQHLRNLIEEDNIPEMREMMIIATERRKKFDKK